MEKSKQHIRHIMLWEFQNGSNAANTAKKICDDIGEGVVSERTLRNWFAKFRSGDTSFQDEPKPGRSTDVDDNVLKVLVKQNPRQTTRKLADKMRTSQSTICRHLEKLGKVSKLGVWFPHELSKNGSPMKTLSEKEHYPKLNIKQICMERKFCCAYGGIAKG
ncbi:histone-lysine N-methyltransferase SETMAR-like [Osmia bicornis bicornis]|uniref:histone-lysine N-methyltransferase SETMAR-like n=1 Tax=Osmia bicornis bicornis TaxID=1437191 RepID=UPI001EAF22F5|nr:histone-lysine N-methyltransferase SETMAR-like [Osmia bicornis bicornis]